MDNTLKVKYAKKLKLAQSKFLPMDPDTYLDYSEIYEKISKAFDDKALVVFMGDSESRIKFIAESMLSNMVKEFRERNMNSISQAEAIFQ